MGQPSSRRSDSEEGSPERYRRQKINRRSLIAGSIGAAALAAGWRQSTAGQDASPEATLEIPEYSDALLDEVIVALAAAGVAVYQAPFSPLPIIPLADYGPVSLLRSQARAMVLEATNRAGILGSDLDDLVKSTDGAVATSEPEATVAVDEIPPSALLAGYVAGGDSPGAELARRFMPAPDAAESENVVFPGLVLTLFAAEIAKESAGDATAGVVAPLTAGGMRAFVAQTGICSTIQGFIDQTINSLFNALQVNFGNSVPGRILGGVLNFLLGGAKAAVQEAVKRILAPVLDVIKTIAGVIGTASLIVSAIRPWSLRMTPEPAATRLAVGAESPIPGTINCAVDLGGFDEWPADIADCAAQSGTPLPPLKPAGATCSWLIAQSRFPVPLMAPKTPPSTLDDNGAAAFAYVTLSEDEKTAKGTPINGWVRVTLTIERPELDRLRQTLANLLFAQLPAIVAQFVRPILGPVVDKLLVKLQSFTDTKSSVIVPVLYHEKKDDPTPVPTAEPGAPATVSVTFEPIAETPFPVLLAIDAATCNGIDWEGMLRVVFQVETEVVTLDLDQTRPIAWSFESGDSTTSRSGPFQAPLKYSAGGQDQYVVTTEWEIARELDDAGGTAALTFNVTATVAIAGMSETNTITGASNLGVPIPVTSGNDDC
jgi:hypothetical protein